MIFCVFKLRKSALEVSPYKWKGGLVRQPDNVHVAEAPGLIFKNVHLLIAMNSKYDLK